MTDEWDSEEEALLDEMRSAFGPAEWDRYVEADWNRHFEGRRSNDFIVTNECVGGKFVPLWPADWPGADDNVRQESSWDPPADKPQPLKVRWNGLDVSWPDGFVDEQPWKTIISTDRAAAWSNARFERRRAPWWARVIGWGIAAWIAVAG